MIIIAITILIIVLCCITPPTLFASLSPASSLLPPPPSLFPPLSQCFDCMLPFTERRCRSPAIDGRRVKSLHYKVIV